MKQEKTSLGPEENAALENINKETGVSKSSLIRQAVIYWLKHGPYACRKEVGARE